VIHLRASHNISIVFLRISITDIQSKLANNFITFSCHGNRITFITVVQVCNQIIYHINLTIHIAGESVCPLPPLKYRPSAAVHIDMVGFSIIHVLMLII